MEVYRDCMGKNKDSALHLKRIEGIVDTKQNKERKKIVSLCAYLVPHLFDSFSVECKHTYLGEFLRFFLRMDAYGKKHYKNSPYKGF